MQVFVAYATLEKQVEIAVQLPLSATVEMAIQASGIMDLFPEIKERPLSVGLFGKQVNLTQLLHENDRVEIYRPLKIDPKQARRLRAAKKSSPNSDSPNEEKIHSKPRGIS